MTNKIIFHRYNSICEPDFIEAFMVCGIDVIEDCAEMTEKNIPMETRVNTLADDIMKHHPLFVFSINFFPYISMVCEKLGVMYVCVSVDCPVIELYSTQIRNSCNRIFLFDYKQYDDICDENPGCIFYLPLGVNVDRINRTIGEPDWNHMDYDYDVSFVGSLYNEKNPLASVMPYLSPDCKRECEKLLAKQEPENGQLLLETQTPDELVCAIRQAAGDSFYGSEGNVRNTDCFEVVNQYLSKELTIRDRFNILTSIQHTLDERPKQALWQNEHNLHLFTRSNTVQIAASAPGMIIHGGVSTLTQMPQVFRRSKINLNITMRSIQTGLPQRIWDVLGCGGFLLTDYQAELPEWLDIGKHVAAYETVEEACELTQFYLTHDEERLEIARAGYECVKSRDTVLKRVIEIIRTISG